MLQGGGGTQNVRGVFLKDDGRKRRIQRGNNSVPKADIESVRSGRRDVLVPRDCISTAEAEHGRGPVGGGVSDVRSIGLAFPENRGQTGRYRNTYSELQLIQSHPISLLHDCEPLQAPDGYKELQSGRHGVQRRANLRGPGQRPSESEPEPEHVRGGGEHREHHAELVLRERPLHASLQLHLPHGRRGGAAVEQATGASEVQVRAGPHGPHAQGSGRQKLRVRVPEGGREGDGGGVAGPGADGGGRRRPEDEHHHSGAPGAAADGADALLLDVDPEEGLQLQGEAVHTRLQAGFRAFLHPCRWAGRAGRAPEELAPHRLAHGALPHDSPPLREHLQQLPLVRARLHRG